MRESGLAKLSGNAGCRAAARWSGSESDPKGADRIVLQRLAGQRDGELIDADALGR